MKKWILFFLILIAFGVAAVYILIPREISISRGVIAKSNALGAGRILTDHSNWEKLWPGKDSETHSRNTLYFNGFSYDIKKKNYNTYEVLLAEESHYEGSILLVLLNTDSIGIEWRGKVNTGNNPVGKLRSYLNAKKIRRNLDDILYAMKVFLEDGKNIYGIKISENKITDSVMISMIKVFNTKPGTADIYGMINPLKAYAKDKGGRETNYPMMGNLPSDNNHFKIITAIPVDKSLPEQKDFVLKRMLFDGNNLATEIKGGPAKIRNAYLQMNNYLTDHQRTLAVSPFEFLVTDRLKETDTTKWVTILNYPVY